MIPSAAGRALVAIRRVPVPLALLLACALFLGSAWSLVTAPFHAFDEPQHFSYALHFGQTGAQPSVLGGTSRFDPAQEHVSDVLGFGRLQQNPAVRPAWRAADERAFERYEATLPAGSQGAGSGPNPLAKNPPLFYAVEGAVSRITPGGLFDDLWAMRAVNVLFLLAAVTFAWLLAAEIFTRTLPRVVVAGIVALHPLLGQISGIVNCDTLLAAEYLALTWLGVRAYQRGITTAVLVALGAAAAACLLTHGRGIVAVPVFVLILAVLVIHHRPASRSALLALLAGVATLAVAFVAYRIYTAASGGGALYAGEASFAPRGANPREFLSFVWQFYLPRLQSMSPRIGPDYGFRQVWVETFFGSFSSYEVNLAKPVLDLVQVTLAGGAAALLAVLVRRWEQARSHWGVIVLVAGPALCMLALLHLASYRALLGAPGDPLITGRYLMPLLGAIGVGAAVLVESLPRRVGPVLAGALLCGLALMSLSGIALTLARSYV